MITSFYDVIYVILIFFSFLASFGAKNFSFLVNFMAKILIGRKKPEMHVMVTGFTFQKLQTKMKNRFSFSRDCILKISGTFQKN